MTLDPHRFRLRDAAALVAVLLASAWVAEPPLPGASGRTIWVAPDGSDLRRGQAPDAAVATVQRAADLARPGDTVRIRPGVYRERVRVRRGGRPGRPVVFVADEPGTVTLSGEAEPAVVAGLVWRDEGDGIWSAETPWPIYHVRVGERNGFFARWGGPGFLREWATRPGAWDAFAWDGENRRLWLRLRHGDPPSDADIAVNDPIPSPREWGNVRSANVWVEAGHVVFDGLRFRGGVGAGLLLWNAEVVTVRDCLFEGAAFGVQTRPRIAPTRRLLLERSLYHNHPQHAWRKEWLPWDQVYAFYSSSTLVASADDGVTVRDNVVADFGDGLRLHGAEDEDSDLGVVIERNLLFRGTDDAIEFDGPGRDVVFRRNLVHDVHESLSFSPVTDGPLVVEDNLFLHPADGINGAQLKFLTPDARQEAGDVIRGVRVTDNVFVGNWLSWWGPPLDGVTVEGNVFAVQRMREPPFHPGVTARDNVLTTLPTDGYPAPGTAPRWWEGRWPEPLRPGPRWLAWRDLPAVADVPRLLAPELVR